MTPEKRVQNSIIKHFKDLENKGYPVYIERRQAGGFSYKKGIPDLYGICKGIHLEIEVKQPGGKLSSMQEKQRDKFLKTGAIYICADNLDTIKDILREKFDIF